jgi:sugar/nucleoside kinase (ribokinase family)
LSDPDYDGGHGERIFINNIGAAGDLLPEDLDEAFFESDIVVFGGTALVPEIHRNLLDLLKKARAKGAVTVVNTVHDFLSEKEDPDRAWPLGASVETYDHIDLLIANMEEALRLSGQRTIEDALSFFASTRLGAVIVTNGAKPLHYMGNGPLFGVKSGRKPVSEKISGEILSHPERVGDTTGCGDNFAGGVIASIARQMMERPGVPPDLDKAMALGTVSGGFACFYNGGTFFEEYGGHKGELIAPYYDDYLLRKPSP